MTRVEKEIACGNFAKEMQTSSPGYLEASALIVGGRLPFRSDDAGQDILESWQLFSEGGVNPAAIQGGENEPRV